MIVVVVVVGMNSFCIGIGYDVVVIIGYKSICVIVSSICIGSCINNDI